MSIVSGNSRFLVDFIQAYLVVLLEKIPFFRFVV